MWDELDLDAVNLVFLAEEHLSIRVNHYGLLRLDNKKAASKKSKLGMIARRARGAEPGDEPERFPAREHPRLNNIEPAVIQAGLRGHDEPSFPTADHHADCQGLACFQRLAIQRTGQVEVSPVTPHRAERGKAVEKLPLQPSDLPRFDGHARSEPETQAANEEAVVAPIGPYDSDIHQPALFLAMAVILDVLLQAIRIIIG